MKNKWILILPIMLFIVFACNAHSDSDKNIQQVEKQKNMKSTNMVLSLRNAVITKTYKLDGTTITEGYVPFGEFKTHFRIAGDLNFTKPPLLLLHGGPGSTHNYFEVLDHLANETGRMLISYDQLGCGESYMENRPELWVAQTWVNELDNLITALELKKFHLLGQSWGGMLAISYLADRTQKGVQSVILSSALSDSQLWGEEQHRLAKQLPLEEQQALARAEETNDYTSPAYASAVGHYMQLHCNDQHYGPNAPECLRRPKRAGAESYMVAWGPNELTPLGTLAHWNYTAKLPDIKVPALIFSGTEDLSTPLLAKTMADNLPNSKWELLPNSRHLTFIDAHQPYCEKLSAWLDEKDTL